MICRSDIYGQEKILKHINNAVKTDKPSNSYIIEGEAKSGKKLITNYFAALLQCENRSLSNGIIEPCGKCRSCIQTVSFNNADIIRVVHKKPNLITVDEIREQVIDDIFVKPYTYKYKIYIIEDADLMNVQAQNTLLKTIEEPPEYAIIFLLVKNKQKLLPTILSRCVSFTVKPVKEELVKKYILEHSDNAAPNDIDDYLKFSNGNIGKALDILNNDAFIKELEEFCEFMMSIDKLKIFDLNNALELFNSWKNNINEKLDLMEIWFRDILVLKTDKNFKDIFFHKHLSELKEKARLYSYDKLGRNFDIIEDTKQKLFGNANYGLTMEVLFLELRKM